MTKDEQRLWLKDRNGLLAKCGHGACGGNLFLERDYRGRLGVKCLLCTRERELSVVESLQSLRQGVKI